MLDFDAAMLRDADAQVPPEGGEPAADAGADAGGDTARTSCTGGAATTGSGGERTAHPHISHVISPGWQLLSVGFVVKEDGDSRGPLLSMIAEIRNDTLETECSFLPDVTLDYEDIVTTIESPAHFGEIVDSVTTPCIGPGGTGVAYGVARGITEEDLETASFLDIAVEPGTYSEYWPATDGPTITGAEIAATPDGMVLRGELSVAAAIENFALRVYPRDDRGLLVGELFAAPGDLGLLPAGSTIAFETEASPCDFEDYVAYRSWMVYEPGALTWLPAAWAEVERMRRARRAEMDALRRTRPVAVVD